MELFPQSTYAFPLQTELDSYRQPFERGKSVRYLTPTLPSPKHLLLRENSELGKCGELVKDRREFNVVDFNNTLRPDRQK